MTLVRLGESYDVPCAHNCQWSNYRWPTGGKIAEMALWRKREKRCLNPSALLQSVWILRFSILTFSPRLSGFSWSRSLGWALCRSFSAWQDTPRGRWEGRGEWRTWRTLCCSLWQSLCDSDCWRNLLFWRREFQNMSENLFLKTFLLCICSLSASLSVFGLIESSTKYHQKNRNGSFRLKAL